MRNKKRSRKAKKEKACPISVRRWLAKTDPENWPEQEANTLDDIMADRSVTMQTEKEKIHASDR